MLIASRFTGFFPFTCNLTFFKWVFIAISTPRQEGHNKKQEKTSQAEDDSLKREEKQ